MDFLCNHINTIVSNLQLNGEIYCIKIENNNFVRCGIEIGSHIIFDKSAKVTPESLTLLLHKEILYPVWFLGTDWIGYKIVCDRFPRATTIDNNIQLIGKAILIIHINNEIEYL